jgi:O-antigen ligase
MEKPTSTFAEIFKNDKPLFIETTALCICAAALPFSVTFIQGGLLLFIAMALLRHRKEGQLGAIGAEIKTNPLFIPWTIYLAAAVLSTVFGIAPRHSLGGLNSDLFRVTAFFAFCLFLKPQARDTMLKFYIAAITAGAAWGISQAINGLAHGIEVRAHASDHPVTFGEIMVIGLALALSKASAPDAMSTRSKKLMCGAVLIITSAIALSQTRGAYIGAALVFATVFIANRSQRHLITILFVSTTVLGLALSMFNPVIRYKAKSVFLGANSAVTNAAAPDQSIKTRLILWHTGFKIIKDYPLFGVGINNVKTVFPRYCPPPYPENNVWGSLHNIYINHAAERGIVGLTALLVLFGATLVVVIKSYRTAPSHLTLWALAIMPAWFMMNFTNITFQHVNTSYAVLLALAIAIKSKQTPAPQ